MTLHKYHIGSGFNILAGLFAHIPCCGTQILFSLFGLQAIGTFSTAVVYPLQFAIPLITSLVLTGLFIILTRRHTKHATSAACQMDCAAHGHKPVLFSKDVGRFLALNLLLGYTIVTLLYLFIPPHNHYAIDGNVSAIWLNDQKQVIATYHDPKRFWPWSERHFIALSDNAIDEDGQTFKATEMPWYEALWQHTHHDGDNVPAHIYSRINPVFLLNPQANWRPTAIPPVQYFLKLETPTVSTEKE